MSNIKLSESSINSIKEDLKSQGITKDNVIVLNIGNDTPAKKTIDDIDTNINLSESIDNIISKEKNNTTGLIPFLNEYKMAINNGVPQEAIYEDFISGAASWTYLNAVDTELSALKDRIGKFKENIDLKKFLKIMEQTNSCYLVPILEDYVVDYIDNKNPNTKLLLKNTLMNYSYDPFVRNMIQVIDLDVSKENTMFLGESLEDINSKVDVEKIFSPVQFIKENECIINVKGNYYARKGNNIVKLSKDDVMSLNESFKELCNIVNDNRVVIDSDYNCINLYWGKDKISINENNAIINNNAYTLNEIDNLAYTSYISGADKSEMFHYVKMLMENFDNIAPIDFVRHIVLKNSLNESADLFRIKNNIFITTHDNKHGRHTFYRNVNPIQTASIINEHLNLNVSKIFEDLMPKPDKIKKDIEESKAEYESLINTLQEKLDKIDSMTNEDSDKDSVEEVKSVIKEELEKTKNEYKEYCNKADKFLEAEGDDESPEDMAAEFDDHFADDSDDSEILDVTINKGDDSLDIDTAVTEPITDDEFDYDVQEYDPNMVYSDNGNFVDSGSMNSQDSYQIVKVLFDENVKTSTQYPRGSVYVMIPMINPNGDKVTEMQKISFTLDDSGWVVINNEYMPEAMYNSIVSAIKSEPNFNEIVAGADWSGNDNSGMPAKQDSQIVPVTIEDNTEVIEDPVDNIDTLDSINIDDENPEDINIESEFEIGESAGDNNKILSLPLRTIYNIRPLTLMRDLRNKGVVTRYKPDTDTIDVVLTSNDDIVNVRTYLIDNKIYTVEQIAEMFPVLSEIFKVNEGIELKITDDKTGKKYTVDLTNISGEEKKEDDKKDKENSDEVTFNPEDSLLYNPDEEDEDETKSEEKKEDDKTSDESKEKNESATEEKKPKFKFKFKPKQLGEVHAIHESLEPQVLDKVSYKGKKGQIVSILGNGDIILEVAGSTVEAAPSEIKIITNREDNVPAPYKFDKTTLKALYEQMVECGIYMNNICISQPNCYVKYSDWQEAKDDDNINILMLNESHAMQKKYVKIHEDVNSFANIDDYVSGVEVTADGEAIRNVLINVNDYLAAEGGNNSVRVLIDTDDENQKKKLVIMPKDSLKTLTI